MASAESTAVRSSAFSMVLRLPSSQAARMVIALAGPTPLYCSNWRMLSFPSVFRLLLQSPSTHFIRSTALSFGVPLPIRMPKSSALLKAEGPSRSNFSRGRSSSAHFAMLL